MNPSDIVDRPSDTVLVIPTIREESFNQFVKRWRDVGLFDYCDLIVMEDNPRKTFEIPKLDCLVQHFDWQDIDDDMGENSWIIPRRSDTVRSYGYFRARHYDYVLTLDDDCYPCGDEDGLNYDGLGFLNSHKAALNDRTRWFNTLNSVKPRGIPFYNLGKNGKVMVNHGLWTNVLDYDAPYQLANPIREKFSFDNRIVPANSYFPMCGMNVMWKGEVTVLMYHMLMGQIFSGEKKGIGDTGEFGSPQLTKLPFDRWGDIGCGIVMKKILDEKGLNVSTGMPYIRHERASNPFTNLKKEANVLEVNEKLWEYIDSVNLPLNSDLVLCYDAMGKHLSKWTEFPEYVDYFQLLGKAMCTWASLFVNNMDKDGIIDE